MVLTDIFLIRKKDVVHQRFLKHPPPKENCLGTYLDKILMKNVENVYFYKTKTTLMTSQRACYFLMSFFMISPLANTYHKELDEIQILGSDVLLWSSLHKRLR